MSFDSEENLRYKETLPVEKESITQRRTIDETTGEIVDQDQYNGPTDLLARQAFKLINKKYMELKKQIDDMTLHLKSMGEMRSEELTEYRKAYAACKAEMTKQAELPQLNSGSHRGGEGTASSLGALEAYANPFLSKYGFGIEYEFYETNDEPKREYVKTCLIHTSGQFKCSLNEVIVEKAERAKVDVFSASKPQKENIISNSDLNASYTHAKKRGYQFLLGLHSGK